VFNILRHIHSLVGIFLPDCELLPPWTKEDCELLPPWTKELLLTCTCWLTPGGSAGASQGVSLIMGPRHPRRLTPSSLLASGDGHNIPPRPS
jgi:hypothetical protein